MFSRDYKHRYTHPSTPYCKPPDYTIMQVPSLSSKSAMEDKKILILRGLHAVGKM